MEILCLKIEILSMPLLGPCGHTLILIKFEENLIEIVRNMQM